MMRQTSYIMNTEQVNKNIFAYKDFIIDGSRTPAISKILDAAGLLRLPQLLSTVSKALH